MSEQIAGVLSIDKPRGMTSRELVDEVEEVFSDVKAGHGGTLDRLARGVLPVFLGPATRLVPFLQERSKTYEAVLRFDRESPTLDLDGPVSEVSVPRAVEATELRSALGKYEGQIDQKPPVYSALKRDGERLSARARRGESVEVESRSVRVDQLRLLEENFPWVRVEIKCGSGFYVRSLARDLAEELALDGALVEELVRTTYGPLDLANSTGIDEKAEWEKKIQPPSTAVDHLSREEFAPDKSRLLTHGTPVGRGDYDPPETLAAFNKAGRLLAVLEPRFDNGCFLWQPKRVFNF